MNEEKCPNCNVVFELHFENCGLVNCPKCGIQIKVGCE